jgi:hypothetical protein
VDPPSSGGRLARTLRSQQCRCLYVRPLPPRNSRPPMLASHGSTNVSGVLRSRMLFDLQATSPKPMFRIKRPLI